MAVIKVSYNSLDISENGFVPAQFDVIATGVGGTVDSVVAGRVVLRANSPIVWPISSQGRRGDDSFVFYLDDASVLVPGQQVIFDVHASGAFAIAANVNS